MSTEQDLLPTIINQASSFDTVETGWYQDVGTVAWDTSEKKVGSQSVRLTTTAWTGSEWMARTAKDYSPAISIAGKNFGFWLKAPSTALYVSVIFLNDYGWSNYAFEYIELTWCRPQGNTWRFFPFCSGTLNTVGSFNPNNVIQIIVSVVSSSNTAQFWFDGVYEQANEFPNGAVVIRIDDGNVEDFTLVKPVLDTYGYKACSFLVKNTVNTLNGTMTYAQVRQLHQEGWDMCNHSTSHASLPSLTEAQITDEVLTCKKFLQEMGIKNGYRFFASPFASHSPTSEAVINQYNIVSTGVGGTIPNVGDTVPYPLFNPYLIDATDCTYTTTVQQLQQWASAVKSAKALGVVLFHKIVTGTPNEYQYNVNDFASFIQYLNQQGIPVLTFTDLLRRYYIDVQVNFSLQSYTIPALNQVNFVLQEVGVPAEVVATTAVTVSSVIEMQTFLQQLLSVISSLSSEADRQQYLASILSIINSVTSRIDVQTYMESRLSTVLSASTVVDYSQLFELLSSLVTTLSQVTATQTYKDTLLTTILEVATVRDLQTYIHVLQSIIASSVSEVDKQIYLNILQSIASSSSSVGAVQTYLQLLQTLVTSQVTATAVQRFFDMLLTTLNVIDSVSDKAEFLDLVLSLVTELATVTDKQQYFNVLHTVISGSVSVVVLQFYIDMLQVLISAQVTVQDLQQFLDVLLTVVGVVDSITDRTQLYELLTTFSTVITQVIAKQEYRDGLQTVGNISSVVISLQHYLDTILSSIASLHLVQDKQQYVDLLLTVSSSVVSVREFFTYVDLVQVLIVSGVSVADIQTFIAQLLTIGSATATLTDRFLGTSVEDIGSVFVSSGYVVERQHFITHVLSTITSASNSVDRQIYVQVLQAIANSSPSIWDFQTYVSALYTVISSASSVEELRGYADYLLASVQSFASTEDIYIEAKKFEDILSSLLTSFSSLADLQDFGDMLYSTFLTSSVASDVAVYVDKPEAGVVSGSTAVDRWRTSMAELGMAVDIFCSRFDASVRDGEVVDVMYRRQRASRESMRVYLDWRKPVIPCLTITLESANA